MIIVGNGQIGTLFQLNEPIDNAMIFASGVSDSKCTDEELYDKERQLLIKNLKIAIASSIVFVYFSSCALTPKDYTLNRYYKHKKEMEDIIKKYTDNYLILRVPQMFGTIKMHPTLINFLFNHIIEYKRFTISNAAYRYVIHMDDLYSITKELFHQNIKSQTIDVANTYRYSVIDIVKILEDLLNIKARYDIVEIEDGYFLDLTDMEVIIKTMDKNIEFGERYLYKKIQYLTGGEEL